MNFIPNLGTINLTWFQWQRQVRIPVISIFHYSYSCRLVRWQEYPLRTGFSRRLRKGNNNGRF
ncbi:Uncharacterized protein BM_BM267 [Brugia malayi]|uniref:Uncharacterized protein n=1 Tax=Brugia malayi TaxID=6279 RepID=A0A4E9EVJ8_BRUMA|nr:Uncharacterized protein BM_BM267 [Brugia malayi]VIO88134.1 Uncharacterized protein BM_BM267 [Brugia malayi]